MADSASIKEEEIKVNNEKEELVLQIDLIKGILVATENEKRQFKECLDKIEEEHVTLQTELAQTRGKASSFPTLDLDGRTPTEEISRLKCEIVTADEAFKKDVAEKTLSFQTEKASLLAILEELKEKKTASPHVDPPSETPVVAKRPRGDPLVTVVEAARHKDEQNALNLKMRPDESGDVDTTGKISNHKKQSPTITTVNATKPVSGGKKIKSSGGVFDGGFTGAVKIKKQQKTADTVMDDVFAFDSNASDTLVKQLTNRSQSTTPPPSSSTFGSKRVFGKR